MNQDDRWMISRSIILATSQSREGESHVTKQADTDYLWFVDLFR